MTAPPDLTVAAAAVAVALRGLGATVVLSSRASEPEVLNWAAHFSVAVKRLIAVYSSGPALIYSASATIDGVAVSVQGSRRATADDFARYQAHLWRPLTPATPAECLAATGDA